MASEDKLIQEIVQLGRPPTATGGGESVTWGVAQNASSTPTPWSFRGVDGQNRVTYLKNAEIEWARGDRVMLIRIARSWVAAMVLSSIITT